MLGRPSGHSSKPGSQSSTEVHCFKDQIGSPEFSNVKLAGPALSSPVGQDCDQCWSQLGTGTHSTFTHLLYTLTEMFPSSGY